MSTTGPALEDAAARSSATPRPLGRLGTPRANSHVTKRLSLPPTSLLQDGGPELIPAVTATREGWMKVMSPSSCSNRMAMTVVKAADIVRLIESSSLQLKA